MFNPDELSILAAALDAELDVLRSIERHGIPTIRQRASVSALQAKIADALEALAKAKAEEPK